MPKCDCIGQWVERLDQVGSTNDVMRERARAGAAEGLIITAEQQLAGRGRLGRSWLAPPGSSLLMSLLLRPRWLAPESAYSITMLAAVALCRAVEQIAPGVRVALKWPNDLLLPASPLETTVGRKAAGILSELTLRGEMIDYVILGMGVNVNWFPSGVVDGRDLGAQATSIAQAAGQAIDREALFKLLVAELNSRYILLGRGQREAIFQAWRGRLHTLGQHVAITTPTGVLRGFAEDVDPYGALLVRDEGGTLHTVTAGEVGA